ncbi:hypothetical protein V2J09_022330 [Rumex salicifolius]
MRLIILSGKNTLSFTWVSLKLIRD